MTKAWFVLLILTMVSMATGKEKESPVGVDEVSSLTYKVVTSKYRTSLLNVRSVSITVSGKGIGAVYNVPSSVYGLNIIATDKLLLVRNRDERNGLILYSDTSSELIDIFKNQCSKISFKTVHGKTTSTQKGMSRRDCETTLEKIKMVEKGATTFYKEAKRKTKLAFQKMFPPEFFEALKTNKPVNDEYSPGWNTWGNGPR